MTLAWESDAAAKKTPVATKLRNFVIEIISFNEELDYIMVMQLLQLILQRRMSVFGR